MQIIVAESLMVKRILGESRQGFKGIRRFKGFKGKINFPILIFPSFKSFKSFISFQSQLPKDHKIPHSPTPEAPNFMVGHFTFQKNSVISIDYQSPPREGGAQSVICPPDFQDAEGLAMRPRA